ncbi:DUF1642 domain-containing protein [Lacticaseibacillus paracasei]|uniref:DUF1642 domain-containing protein n=1 Tax=Lacticaseibacillus paracasei TaxID=1597 RepID=UPI001158B695|nr:DUF1642 domain-containing protein [Lacticaseibacillus paracasei]VTZ82314.1 hypothetical protein LPCP272_00239 [Lacticaseibacillus paracasei]
MSEEKLYAVKNDEGKYWDFADRDGFFELTFSSCPTTAEEEDAKDVVSDYGGHVVTFIEEPEKVAVSPNEAKAIESLLNANTYIETLDPFRYLFTSRYKEDIKRLIKAFKNGYTVAKEKKYRVITPKSWWASENEPEYMHMNVLNGIENYKGADDDTLFTQKQLDLYGLNGSPFTKEEVTDDDE